MDQSIVDLMIRTLRKKLPVEMLPRAEEHIKYFPGQVFYPMRVSGAGGWDYTVWLEISRIMLQLHDTLGPTDRRTVARIMLGQGDNKLYQVRANRDAGWPA